MDETTSDDLKATYGELTSADVTRLDAAAAELGMDSERLMEHAGWQVARSALKLHPERGARVVVVAGRGNNGGDGVVAARLLAGWGYSVAVAVVGQEKELDDAFRGRLQTAMRCGVGVTVGDSGAASHQIEGADFAIDALLGVGIVGRVRPELRSVIAALSRSRTLAVDVPSGLDATTGGSTTCVQAAMTCTLAAVKRGLWTAAGRAAAGRLVVADIGVPHAAWVASHLAVPDAIAGGEIVEVPHP